METKTKFQVFENIEELENYASSLYPLEKLTPTVKEINWDPEIRTCLECSQEFKPAHPAQHFCEDCKSNPNRKKKRNAVVKKMQKEPKIAHCSSCGEEFYKTAPATRKCELCSPKGGTLVNKKK